MSVFSVQYKCFVSDHVSVFSVQHKFFMNIFLSMAYSRTFHYLNAKLMKCCGYVEIAQLLSVFMLTILLTMISVRRSCMLSHLTLKPTYV